MLGRTHAVSGAAGWLAGCAGLAAAGCPPSGYAVAVGAVVAAGTALIPDIDHPESTIAHTLGPVTQVTAEGVQALSGWLLGRSCRHCAARPPRGGHRGLTHTGVFAVLVGVLAGVAGWLAGPAGGLTVVWIGTGLAVRAVLPYRQRRRHVAFAVTVLVTAAAAAFAPAPVSWWWVGVPAGWGTLAHTLGDGCTLSGVPLAWPWYVRGCRWTHLGIPHALRFSTGHTSERVVWWGLVVCGLACAGYLAAG
ncbi:metal-dependent hydrolase [Micromonospora sp. NPDC006766]|uniref:metal-dependent hydrolase n=1 Tax=Micromonospora sp. NPDC006766 TaxID=3154778 RepID=UPI0033E3B343